MHLFKSGKHVRKWRDFFTPTVRLGLKESILFLEIV
jgi:hypothetical protein